MAHQVFISYASKDRPAADATCATLESKGIRCWMAPRDITPGADWSESIIDAINSAKAFVLVFSSHANESRQIKREVQHAFDQGVPVIPMRIENVAPLKALQYYLATPHWLDAFTPPLLDHLNYLAEVIRGIMDGRPVAPHGGAKPAMAHEPPVLPGHRPATRAVAAPRLRGFGRHALAAGAIVLPIAAAAGAWLLWPARHWTVESSRPFISTLALEGEPAFSADGKMLAYTSGAEPLSRKIYMHNLAGGDAIKVTSDAYDDVSPSWSPDGTRIAYVAQKPGEPCRLMVATVPGGQARQAGRCTQGQSSFVSWQPGTSLLYYADRAGDSGVSIFRLDLDSGALLRLARKTTTVLPELRDLKCSPDGKSLLYVWGQSASTDVMTVRDLASGEERTLGKLVGGGSAAWSEDSRAVLASRASGIGSEITAYPADGEAPYRVYTTTINVSHLAAGTGGFLALETDTSRQNLARARLKPAAQPDIIDLVNGKTWAPTFAPDGTLAFLSNRSGTNAVWTMKPGAAPSVLFDAGLVPLFRLQYSPDGTRLAMVIAGEDGLTTKILTADGGTVASFDSPTMGYANPVWTPDGKAVIIFDRRVNQLVRIATDNPARRTPVAAAPPWESVAFHNGTYAVKFATGGIWQFGKLPNLITGKYPRDFAPPVVFRGDDVLIPDFNFPGGARILSQPLAGGPDRVLGYVPGAEALDRFFESKMAVNPKTGEVIYVAAVQGDTNIDLLTLSRH